MTETVAKSQIRSLDAALKREVRLAALRRGITLGMAINEAMALWLVRETQQNSPQKREGRGWDNDVRAELDSIADQLTGGAATRAVDVRRIV